MSRFLMKNLSIPKVSKEDIKKTQEIVAAGRTPVNAVRTPVNGVRTPVNALRANPMRSKAKDKGKGTGNPPPYKKKKISQALREQVWLARFGRVFEHKCYVTWCKNTITVFDFESGHNIPESKGGKTDLTNLFPICRKCNGSMGDRYSIDEWNTLHTPIPLPPQENLEVHSEETISRDTTEKSPKRRNGWCRFFCWST